MTIVHLYIAFLAIGAFGLLASLILGEFSHDGADFHHEVSGGGDAHDGSTDSPRLLSVRTIFAFLLAFAIGGGSMYLSGKSLLYQIPTGFGAGIGTAVFVYYIMKFLYSFQGNSNMDSNDLIGSMGVVTIGTTNMGLCQVKLDTQGGDVLFMAQEANSKPLDKFETVKVTGKIGNTLLVSKQ
jgi:membrane protein implicated in regulation of membrane protease activity